MRALVALAVAACTAAMGLASCTEPGAPGSAAALEFDSLPAPSVVLGDTLRDPFTGAAAPLAARVFDPRGEPLDVPVMFLALDPEIVQIDEATGLVMAVSDTLGGVRIIASAGGLQSPPLTLFLTRDPDTIYVKDTSTTFVLEHDFVTPILQPLTVRVATAAGDSAVRRWLVRFEVEESAENPAPGTLVSTGTTISPIDTTDDQGIASRTFRFDPTRLPAGVSQDTIVVRASAFRRGAPLAGSPVIFILIVRPKSAS